MDKVGGHCGDIGDGKGTYGGMSLGTIDQSQYSPGSKQAIQ